MQAISIFGFKFKRTVEEPVRPISREDLADQSESHKRNSSEAALETSERKTSKR